MRNETTFPEREELEEIKAEVAQNRPYAPPKSTPKEHWHHMGKVSPQDLMDNSQHFLKSCWSEPHSLDDLKPGDVFILFPCDGDDSGHGGFKGAGKLWFKIEPFHPGKGYHESFRNTCREFDRPEIIGNWPLSIKVIRIPSIKAPAFNWHDHICDEETMRQLIEQIKLLGLVEIAGSQQAAMIETFLKKLFGTMSQVGLKIKQGIL